MSPLMYRNTTFCDSDCLNLMCERYFGFHDTARAEEMNAHVTLNNFSSHCKDYIHDEGDAVQVPTAFLNE